MSARAEYYTKCDLCLKEERVSNLNVIPEKWTSMSFDVTHGYKMMGSLVACLECWPYKDCDERIPARTKIISYVKGLFQ